jgi:uncharacterized small protein (DUF1192 family)
MDWYPPQPPTTGIGALQQETSELRCALHRKADSYEVITLRSHLDSLQRSVGELSTEIASLRTELQAIRESQLKDER